MDGSVRGVLARNRPVRIECDRLAPGERAAWHAKDHRHLQSDRVLHVVIGSGRGCLFHGAPSLPAVLVPLRGRVRISDRDGMRTLHKGELFVCDVGHGVQAVGGANAIWVALIASASVWRQVIALSLEAAIPDPILLPATHRADRALRRAAVALARHAHVVERSEGSAPVLTLTTLLADLQCAFDPMIARCPGRTLAQRRGVFLRLQRVRNLMHSCVDLDIGIPGFARMANFSACHFVHTFSSVFGETPHAVLVEQRLKRAMRLVSETSLSITEVARESGFEDRCAFARSFKRRFGDTATAIRKRIQPALPAH